MSEEIRDLMPLFRNSEPIKPSSPLQFEILKCTSFLACKLNSLWHSRFPVIDPSNVIRNKDYICFVAAYDNFIYAVAIWSSPIAANRMKEGSVALELRRLAISPDAPKNTASRMLSVMRKQIKKRMPHIKLFVSYQDTDVHCGTIYKASGWLAGTTSKQGMDWNNRQRSKSQSTAAKVRWELRV
jgi:hypothetical protein